LGQEYLEKLEIAWADNHIDFYEDTNKRDGAYSTGGSGVDPIILMNWDDKLNGRIELLGVEPKNGLYDHF
jgi:oligoendopeptidase F